MRPPFDLFAIQNMLIDLAYVLGAVFVGVFFVVGALMWITRNCDDRRR